MSSGSVLEAKPAEVLEQLPKQTRHVAVVFTESDAVPLQMRAVLRRMDEVWTTCFNSFVDVRHSLGLPEGAPPRGAVLVRDVPQAAAVLPRILVGYVIFRVAAWVHQGFPQAAGLVGLHPFATHCFVEQAT